jgi:hypothetical protein
LQAISKQNASGPTDPRSLLYFFPTMPAVKLAKLWQQWHQHKLTELAVQMARMAGRKLVHRSLLSHQRRKRYADRYVKIGHQVFYSLAPDELPKRARDIKNEDDVIIGTDERF